MKHQATIAAIGLLALLTPLLLADCASLVAQAPIEPAKRWEVVLEVKPKQFIRMAAFHDEINGLTGGPTDTKTYYTTDGGENWTKTESSARCIYGLDIVDEQVAWQCGAHATHVSTDGGQNWEQVHALRNGGHGCRLSFADAETGWVTLNDQVRLTTDGGATWEAITLPEGVTTEDIAGMTLRTSSDGYIVDYAGVLHATQDGGQTWAAQPLPAEQLAGMEIVKLEVPSAAIRFFDADRGVIILSLAGGGQSEVLALRTTDGGQTWKAEEVPVEIGALYLSHDGTFLTVYGYVSNDVTVIRYAEN